jgi:excisionase family DNA binding protein
MSADLATQAEPLPLEPMLKAKEVARLTGLALPTVYEIARTNPKRLGAEKFGRGVRFKRHVIQRIVGGASD